MNTTHRFLVLSTVAATAAFFAGCASEGVKNPSGVPVTDKMARSILGTPAIASATTPPRIVIDPVENATRFPIDKSLFSDRIRIMLNSKASGRVVFLARERMKALEHERELKLSGQVTSSYD